MSNSLPRQLGLGLLGLALSGASLAAPKPAEPTTATANSAVLEQLPFADTRAFDDARRGFIAALPDGLVVDGSGRTAWNMAAYAFLDKEQAPATVNPSLWRQARLNAIHGLFEVVEGMYQIRGMDLANMTIIEGETGLIIIDPLLTPATAKAGLELYYQHRPQKPVVAVLYTHNHADHFGGVKGVIDEADVRAGKVKVYAPYGFMEHAVSENVIAGNAMARRATYQFGAGLPAGERGHVDTGLGKALASGPLSLIAPTNTVPDDATLTIDGIEIEFQMAHGTEAEAEMMMYFPQFKVLNTAEITSQHLHNIYTIRGAAIRDASAWSHYIDRALERFGDRADILIAQHHWPIWERERAQHFLAVQRDLYKFIHDQTVRMMNKGQLPGDIAENIKLPASLDQEWYARGYYGTLKHNARGVYQRYMGWYDANPANLDPLPPRQNAAKTIEYMGGADKVLEQARQDFANGEYRWVAWVMSQAVFADPDNRAARELGADALEQLGYQAEAGTWRGAYLMGAQELRNGVGEARRGSGLDPDLLQALEAGMFFDLLAVRLNPEKADGKHLVINWSLTDLDEHYRLNLQNATLTYRSGALAEQAHASVSMTRETLDQILLRRTTFPEAVQGGQIKVEGEPKAFFALLQMLDEPSGNFPIVEPVR
ncbi:alkyl/aryl-sulfatase [Halopseudomonas phragmitis]|uniref:Linear primary-alkylsulfatase n=2 Tax=Pseudomonadaceae TaxID=135621 RepID=A0A1V0B1D5_9GAMM|nr:MULTISPECIES: alkyl sulfatase dimerization domain-containing protein [Pseudomonadaceae]AQZ93715.1 alkyl/aryl-sulfatase [Halopseudomonas phragmitis]RHW20045.1 alkyl/aryl-sulfatase [Pseudomonas jilinensis]